MDRREITRFVINGVIATAVHFSILTISLELIGLNSAGLSNFIAAIFGITSSYIGSRFYVFQKSDVPVFGQAGLFILLYGAIAMLHGLFLYGWTDIHRYDYRAGFILATCIQVVLSYCGNKYLVFVK